MNYTFYKIVCKNESITDCYVGSTTDFTRRKINHKYHCNHKDDKKYGLFVYDFIRKNGGWDNWDMIIIETLEFETKFDARCRERHWIETLNASLNIIIPSQTAKEYEKKKYEENREKELERARQYREENKDKIKEKRNTEEYKEQQKEYREKNKEKIKEQHRRKYEENREKILEKANKKITCECGITVSNCNLLRHYKSKFHIDTLKSK